MIATLILKSLATGYALIAILYAVFYGMNGFEEAPAWSVLVVPLFAWPFTLGASILALLIFKAIDEHKDK